MLKAVRWFDLLTTQRNIFTDHDHMAFSPYRPILPFKNAHVNTITPHLLRQSLLLDFDRFRIDTPDGDFLDVDYIRSGNQAAVLLLHGLEGSSGSHYVKGMSRYLLGMQFDVFVMNFRGCSGEPNKLYSSYHSGKTDDPDLVINYLQSTYQYNHLFLTGFSLGGNISLKYLGESKWKHHPSLRGCAAISVPCDLQDSAMALKKTANHLYMSRFMRMLKAKIRTKANMFPEAGLTESAIKKCRHFIAFDNLYTAPAHGFDDAEHYWSVCSSKPFIPAIKIKTLIINALDDPFFGSKSQPFEEVAGNDQVTLLSPKSGGHVGFASLPVRQPFWHEKTIVQFFLNCINENQVI